ncbi:DNL zinc finger-domain-containing protein [Aspergillus multicolor]|uniref:DNL-type zinc finger protein n=1 Tax=Aspergillus multicolor TaxID=41759 RepID=UPI003CCC98CC
MVQPVRFSHTLRALHSALHQPQTQQSLSRGASRLYSPLSPSRHSRPLAPRYLPNKATNRAAPFIQTLPFIRHNSDGPSKPLTDRFATAEQDAEAEAINEKRRAQEPAYQLTFTCKPCGERSSHRVSKHGYHRGTVLIQCPSCKNRHVISDHLNIFFDRSKTLDDLLEERGQTIVRGTLQGDMEFWDDGSVTEREKEGEDQGK